MMVNFKNMTSHWLVKCVVLVFFVILILCSGLFWLYSGKTSELKWSLLSSLHLPVGKVGDTYMSASLVHEYIQLTNILGTEAPSLGRMLTLEVVARGKVEVDANKLEATQKELDTNELYQEVVRVGGKSLAMATLGKQYVLNTRLRTWYASQSSLEPSLSMKVKRAHSELSANKSWVEVASEMSDDTATKWFAGDTGYVDLSQAVPEYAQVVSRLPVNVLSTVYSRYGVHLVQVRERTQHNGVELTKLQEVVFRTQNFDAWLAEETRKLVFAWYLQ